MNPSSSSSSTMRANSRSLVAILLLGAVGLMCLVALVQAAPAHDAEESSEYAAGNPSSDESSAIGDPEFDNEGRANANGQQEDEDLAPNSNPMSMADSQDEPRGLDSNIANAKVQVNPVDMATAAGHHYHGHSVSGKMEMGAHTEKKGAFGWHAKFPVGGKGKK